MFYVTCYVIATKESPTLCLDFIKEVIVFQENNSYTE